MRRDDSEYDDDEKVTPAPERLKRNITMPTCGSTGCRSRSRNEPKCSLSSTSKVVHHGSHHPERHHHHQQPQHLRQQQQHRHHELDLKPRRCENCVSGVEEFRRREGWGRENRRFGWIFFFLCFVHKTRIQSLSTSIPTCSNIHPHCPLSPFLSPFPVPSPISPPPRERIYFTYSHLHWIFPASFIST